MRSFHFQLSTINCQLFLPLFLSVLLLIGCNDLNDNYSTNPNHRLSFSVDTLSFDTVFTTIGSATRQLMVYNTNSEPLNIESIRVANPSKSGFRINVDGLSGESFSNVRILDKDSMYVFIEVTVDPTGNDQPLSIEDKLEFTTNGVIQSVLLNAYGQDVNLYKGGLFISKDTTWTAERPYLIYDSVVINKDVTLTIENGASIFMHDKARWLINGTLHAIGTTEKPIIFRGDRLDNLLSGLPYDRIQGQWDGIYFHAESFNNKMEHVIIRNGDTGLRFYESSIEQSKLRIKDSQITNTKADLFYAENCNIEAVNTEFSNAGGKVLSLFGGEYYFAHCTFANFLRISPGRNGESTVNLSNFILAWDDNGVSQNTSELKATFDNCIIDGSLSEGDTPLKGEININKLEGAELNYTFNHCAVKTMKTDDSHFINTQFINNDYAPAYKQIGDSENDYTYNFRLDISRDNEDNPDKEQIAIGKADRSVSEKYPVDRFGIDRITSDDGPDIGAYEYVPDPETN